MTLISRIKQLYIGTGHIYVDSVLLKHFDLIEQSPLIYILIAEHFLIWIRNPSLTSGCLSVRWKCHQDQNFFHLSWNDVVLSLAN